VTKKNVMFFERKTFFSFLIFFCKNNIKKTILRNFFLHIFLLNINNLFPIFHLFIYLFYIYTFFIEKIILFSVVIVVLFHRKSFIMI